MKMRFEARCARCRRQMTVGTLAVRMFGGYWHQECAVDYQKARAEKFGSGR